MGVLIAERYFQPSNYFQIVFGKLLKPLYIYREQKGGNCHYLKRH